MERYKFLLDCSCFYRGKNLCSIDYYTVSLIRGFRHSMYFDVIALVRKEKESSLDAIVGFDVPKIVLDERNSQATPWPFIDRLFGFISYGLQQEMCERGIDIVLTPFHFDCRYFFSKKYHQHAVIHDLIPYYIVKAHMGRLRYYCWRIYRHLLIQKIPYYISISKKTQKELKGFHGKDSTVIYNSIAFDFDTPEEDVEGVRNRPYILDVNCFHGHKNAETLIRSFALIKDKIPHLLYLKGDRHYPKEAEDYKKLAEELHLEDRVFIDQSYRSTGEMRYLYSHAALFVSPSLMEGFGWTPIEAAILKAPVLVSDIEVLKEVTCDKVPTFDPFSPIDLAEKMLTILRTPPSRESREDLSRFYQEKYSLKRQIDSLTELFLQKLKAKR